MPKVSFTRFMDNPIGKMASSLGVKQYMKNEIAPSKRPINARHDGNFTRISS